MVANERDRIDLKSLDIEPFWVWKDLGKNRGHFH